MMIIIHILRDTAKYHVEQYQQPKIDKYFAIDFGIYAEM